MTEILYEFAPTSNDRLYLWLGIAFTIIGYGTAWWLLTRKRTGRERTMFTILAMLAFFVGLMAMSTAFFSGWSLRKQGKVELSRTAVILGNAVIPYQDVKKIYYKKDKSGSIFQGQGTTNTFLVIEQRGGKTHVISEEQYPIGEIMTRIKEITKKD